MVLLPSLGNYNIRYFMSFVKNMNQSTEINEFTKKVNSYIVEQIKKKWAKETKENNRKQKWYFRFLK